MPCPPCPAFALRWALYPTRSLTASCLAFPRGTRPPPYSLKQAREHWLHAERFVVVCKYGCECVNAHNYTFLQMSFIFQTTSGFILLAFTFPRILIGYNYSDSINHHKSLRDHAGDMKTRLDGWTTLLYVLCHLINSEIWPNAFDSPFSWSFLNFQS